MRVKELLLENIKCFEKEEILFHKGGGHPCKWITLLGENGTGKSTILQALGLLLAGPDNATKLVPMPTGWVRDEDAFGKMKIIIKQDEKADQGKHGIKQVVKKFSYDYELTGSKEIEKTVGADRQLFTSPTLITTRSSQGQLGWLRKTAFRNDTVGWFAVGYGANRQFTKEQGSAVPMRPPRERYANFLTQFSGTDSLGNSYRNWMMHLKLKSKSDNKAEKRYNRALEAINELFPKGEEQDDEKLNDISISRIDDDGVVWFKVEDREVMDLNLSDGYRNILALAGDVIWRMMEAFPNSEQPLKEPGVVLIDELDIHLHPKWQQELPRRLQEVFPKIQFIIATHSPIIAVAAGEKAMTYKLELKEGITKVERLEDLYVLSVEKVLKSEAFDLKSLYNLLVKKKIDRYYALISLQTKKGLTTEEEKELNRLRPLITKSKPLEHKMDEFIAKYWK